MPPASDLRLIAYSGSGSLNFRAGQPERFVPAATGSSMSSFQPRKPAGSPHGGQFDSKPHAVMDAALDSKASVIPDKLAGAVVVGAHLDGRNFYKRHAEDLSMKDCTLTDTIFDRANLNRLYATCCTLDGTRFDNADMTYGLITDCTGDATMCGANMDRLSIWSSYLTVDAVQSYMRKADISNTFLGESNFEGTDFTAAHITDSDLNAARLHRADLGYTRVTNTDMTNTDMTYADLTQARLTLTNLGYANMASTQWEGACAYDSCMDHALITNAEMKSSEFINTTAVGAEIADCSIKRCTFEGVDFTDATFKGNHVQGDTTFEECDFTGVDLTGNWWRRVTFAGCTLGEANTTFLKGLPDVTVKD